MPQILHPEALPSKLLQSCTSCLLIGGLVIEVKDVLPGLALYRAGLHLAQIRVVVGEYLERRNQGSGPVFYRKGNTHFVWIWERANLGTAANQEKAGVIGRIVFDISGQDLSPVGQSGLLAGYGAPVPAAVAFLR